MTVSHGFTSLAADGAIPGFIQPSHWNAQHTVDLSTEYTSSVHVDLRKTCTGDGVANDTGALNAAIASAVALAPTGVDVYLASGKVYLTDKFTHSYAGAKVRFYGGGTLKLRTADEALVKVAHATAELVLDDIKIDGSNLQLSSPLSGLAYGTLGRLTCVSVEVFNTGVPANGFSGGIAANGAILNCERCYLHNVRGYGIHVTGTTRAWIKDNQLDSIGSSGIYISHNTTVVVSDGCQIEGNILTNITNDIASTGQYGNGVHVFNVSNVTIGPNFTDTCSFSGLRIAGGVTSGSITGGTYTNSGETGLYLELGAKNYAVTGPVVDGAVGNGLSVVNLSSGAGLKGIAINGAVVLNFGTGGVNKAGIICEQGLVSGCFVDGMGLATAAWGILLGVAGAGISANYQVQGSDNQVAGCKYDIGTSFYNLTPATARVVIKGTMNVRQDANYVSPVGAIGSGLSDQGPASALANMAARIFWDTNYFNFPTAEAPTVGEAGSRMKIGGYWHVADTTGVWRAEVDSLPVTDTITYSASMTPATFSAMNRASTITATNTTGFTINAVPGTPVRGALQTFTIRRSSASALGALTWNAVYKAGVFTQPTANNQTRSVTFQYNGTNWVELYRNSVDIPP